MTVTMIRWLDACAEESSEPHTAVKPYLADLVEVGFLLGEDEHAVTIGMEECVDGVTEPGRWRLHIPKNQIKERQDFKVGAGFSLRRVRPGAVQRRSRNPHAHKETSRARVQNISGSGEQSGVVPSIADTPSRAPSATQAHHRHRDDS